MRLPVVVGLVLLVGCALCTKEGEQPKPAEGGTTPATAGTKDGAKNAEGTTPDEVQVNALLKLIRMFTRFARVYFSERVQKWLGIHEPRKTALTDFKTADDHNSRADYYKSIGDKLTEKGKHDKAKLYHTAAEEHRGFAKEMAGKGGKDEKKDKTETTSDADGEIKKVEEKHSKIRDEAIKSGGFTEGTEGYHKTHEKYSRDVIEELNGMDKLDKEKKEVVVKKHEEEAEKHKGLAEKAEKEATLKAKETGTKPPTAKATTTLEPQVSIPIPKGPGNEVEEEKEAINHRISQLKSQIELKTKGGQSATEEEKKMLEFEEESLKKLGESEKQRVEELAKTNGDETQKQLHLMAHFKRMEEYYKGIEKSSEDSAVKSAASSAAQKQAKHMDEIQRKVGAAGGLSPAGAKPIIPDVNVANPAKTNQPAQGDSIVTGTEAYHNEQLEKGGHDPAHQAFHQGAADKHKESAKVREEAITKAGGNQDAVREAHIKHHDTMAAHYEAEAQKAKGANAPEVAKLAEEALTHHKVAAQEIKGQPTKAASGPA